MRSSIGSGPLSVSGVSVRFGDVQALDSVSLSFGVGVNGILGPNGAGKSTLFRVLTGGLRPDSGAVAWLGKPVATRRDLADLQASIGYLPQDPGWFDGFTVAELCDYMGGLRGMPKAARRVANRVAIESVGLADKAEAKLSALSGGQRRRAFIAQALVHNPRVLVLDEPTSGLDPVQRLQLRGLVASLGRNRVVLLSTHLVEDIAQTARTVYVLDSGHLTWCGTASQLANMGLAQTSGQVASAYELGFLSVLNGAA